MEERVHRAVTEARMEEDFQHVQSQAKSLFQLYITEYDRFIKENKGLNQYPAQLIQYQKEAEDSIRKVMLAEGEFAQVCASKGMYTRVRSLQLIKQELWDGYTSLEPSLIPMQQSIICDKRRERAQFHRATAKFHEWEALQAEDPDISSPTEPERNALKQAAIDAVSRLVDLRLSVQNAEIVLNHSISQLSGEN
jgi:hypothetical protein